MNKYRQKTFLDDGGDGGRNSETSGADSAFAVGLGRRDSEKRETAMRENERA